VAVRTRPGTDTHAAHMPRISIVTSLYKVAPLIEEFHARSSDALERVPGDHEFVYVDDGSPDNVRDVVLGILARDPRVRLVELSRNFGQHRALWSGLQHARGEYVFLIDADLEEDPELVAAFYERMQEKPGEIDSIFGVMERRKGGLSERLGGAVFYWLLNRVSDTPITPNSLNARLMTRTYVDRLLEFGDAEPFLFALMKLNGFCQVAIPCPKTSRGATSYTFKRKLRLALDAMFALSLKPMVWIVWMGLGAAVIGAAGIVGALVQRRGADSLALASVWLMGGLVLTAIGVVGAYVGRILTQTRNRPVAIVRKVYEAKKK